VRQGEPDQLDDVAGASAALAAPHERVAVEVRRRVLVAVGVAGDVEAAEADLL
jgi:hypothetical protein